MRFHRNPPLAVLFIFLLASVAGAVGEDTPAPSPEARKGDEPNLEHARQLMADLHFSEAEKEFQEIVIIDEKLRGPQDAKTLTDRLELAMAQGKGGNTLKAESEMRFLLDIFTRRRGPEHEETLRCRTALARLLDDVGRSHEAAGEYRQILTSRERLQGADSIEVARAEHMLGDALSDEGQYDEAIALYRKAEVIFEKLVGAEEPETLLNRSNLAVAEGEGRNFASAEKDLKDILAIRERQLGPDGVSVLMTCYQLGRVLGGFKKYDEALVYATRAREGLRDAYGPANGLVQKSEKLCVEIRADLARHKAAENPAPQ
jgi:tetratricopeptide (TPR) repeat protein